MPRDTVQIVEASTKSAPPQITLTVRRHPHCWLTTMVPDATRPLFFWQARTNSETAAWCIGDELVARYMTRFPR